MARGDVFLLKRIRSLIFALLILTCFEQMLVLAVAQADYSPERYQYRKQILVQPSGQKYLQIELDGETYNHSAVGGLADLRIAQSAGLEVPYYLYTVAKLNEAKNYPVIILNNSYVPGEYSSFILDFGVGRQANNRVELETPATNFLRRVEIEGTDDLRAAWNKLATSDHIFDFQGSRSTAINYSENNYRYLRVKIVNKSEVPLEVTGAKAYYQVQQQVAENKLTPKLNSRVEDKEKKATILLYDLTYANFPTHRLELAVQDENFNREVSLESSNDQVNWEPSLHSSVIYSYRVDNQIGQQLATEYPEITKRYLKVIIHNQDNQPLKLTDIVAYSMPRKLVFPYQAGQQYFLYYGNPKAQLPSYDLKQIASYLDKTAIPFVKLSPEVANPTYQQEAQPWSEENQWVLWLVLSLLVVVLGTAIFKTIKKLSPE